MKRTAASLLSAIAVFSGCASEPDEATSAPIASELGPTMVDSNGASYFAESMIVRLPADDVAASAVLDAIGGVLDPAPNALNRLGFYRVRLPAGAVADQAISDLVSDDVFAERDYLVEADRTPDDPRFSDLWGLAKIQAEQAWAMGTGSASVVVAVTDTGVDLDHPDLQANLWVNPGEIAGNGVDDDGNGFVDDVNGWDFVSDDANPDDDNGHGTHVAGTVGAVGNDGVGIPGVNWTVSIQAVKMLGASGSGSLFDGASSILYAARNGAQIVNASWGCRCNASYVEDAIRELQANGGLFVAAAGNSTADNDESRAHYPASHPVSNVVSVAATTTSDSLASFSNYGRTRVHVAAPGQGILSTYPGGRYASLSGTSMAAPHVAGMAALLLSLEPSLTTDQLKARLIQSSDPVAALGGRVVANGRVNALRLIGEDRDPPPAPTGVAARPGTSGDVVVTWDLSPEDISEYRVRYGLNPGAYDSLVTVSGSATSARITGAFEGLSVFAVVHAVDRNGNESAPSAEVSVSPSDSTPPPQVIDLSADATGAQRVAVTVSEASGEFSPYWTASNLVDGDSATGWIGPARSAGEGDSITVASDQPVTIQSVSLTANAVYPEFFPRTLDLEASVDGIRWQVLAGHHGDLVGTRLDLNFSPVELRYLRVNIREPAAHESGVYYAGLGEIEVIATAEGTPEVTLSFTAPGDDPGNGRATAYDIRRSTTPLDASNFDTAESIAAPAPAMNGARESVNVAGLAAETLYYFALTATDEAGNRSSLSNIATLQTAVWPPGTIRDLTVGNRGDDWVELIWTATGGDGENGSASLYDMRTATGRLDAGNFARSTPVSGLPLPRPAGSRESFIVDGLRSDVAYRFAVRAIDAVGAVGVISNVVEVRLDGNGDGAPPARVDDLNVYASLAMSSANMRLSAAEGVADPSRTFPVPNDGFALAYEGSEERIAAVDLRSSLSFELSPSAVDVQLAGSGGSFRSIEYTALKTVSGWRLQFDPTPAQAVRVVVNGDLGVSTLDAVVPLAAGEVEYVDLSWVAPGDDGFLGTATEYDLRMSTAPITADTFSQATRIPSEPPLPAGMIEVLTAPALAPETSYWFALVSVDNAGNRSPLSNVVVFGSGAVTPAPVNDLAVSSVTPSSVALSWTASGDDGRVGQASEYELRRSPAPITEANFAGARRLIIPAPQPAGTEERFVDEGLADGTTYYYAIAVIDDEGLRSLLSPSVGATTDDATPPNAVADLTLEVANDTTPAAATAQGSSGAYSESTPASAAVDGRTDTAWLTAGRTTQQEEFVELRFPAETDVSRVRLHVAEGYEDLFPRALRFETLESGNQWRIVSRSSTAEPPADWDEWLLGSVRTSALRVVLTETATWSGQHVGAVSEIEVFGNSGGPALEASWTAPADRNGTVQSYDLRLAQGGIDEGTFDGATRFPTEPPRGPGSLERVRVAGLSPATSYCVALKSVDAAGNASSVSNSPCVTTPGAPPAPIDDLAVASVSPGQVVLSWTAVGDDGLLGRASEYALRYSTERITTRSWDSATAVPTPAPSEPGSAERVTVSGLAGMTRYFFAVRAVDATGFAGELSNVVEVTTPDTVPPGRIDDLFAASGPRELRLSWTATGDNGLVGTARSYDLRVSPTPFDASEFDQVPGSPAPTPRTGGQSESWVVSGLAPEANYTVAIRAVDASGNVGAVSNIVTVSTAGVSPGRVSDLRVTQATGTSLTLAWTATGDDGDSGQAAAYDLRYAASPISEGSFSSATPVQVETPKGPGSAESVTVRGLAGGRSYHFALRVLDERGNRSTLATAQGSTADTVPPAVVTNLQAQTGPAAGTVVLAWTAPGDDDMVGTARRYDVRWSLTPITSQNFAAANAVTSTPAPVAGGGIQSFTVSQLPGESVIHFAIRAADDAGNNSAVSNGASASTPDVAPAQVFDLTQSGSGATSATVRWTAPGDDARSGTVTRYDVRRSDQPINAANFQRAISVDAPAPVPAGTAQELTLAGLAANSELYLALRSVDDRGNWSPLSNVIRIQTADTQNPGTIMDLAAETGTDPNSLLLRWTAPGDDDDQGRATRYELRWSDQAIIDGNWHNATAIPAPPTAQAGTSQSFVARGLPAEQTVFVALRAFDEGGRAGAVSNPTSAQTQAEPPATVTDLRARWTGDGVTVFWSATGDDGRSGTAEHYELRRATVPLASFNFANAELVQTSAPQAPGAAEQVTVTGLAEDTEFWFGVVVVDDTGAKSALSNIVSVVTPDQTAPAAVEAFAASTPSVSVPTLSVVAASASSTLDDVWPVEALLDGDVGTSWVSMGSVSGDLESVTVDLGETESVGGIALRGSEQHLSLLPVDFLVEVSSDAVRWQTVIVEEEFQAEDSGWIEWGFDSVDARFLRLSALETATSRSIHYAVIADLRILGAPEGEGVVNLTWIAPGDDGADGRATRYDILVADRPENVLDASPLVVPAVSDAGSLTRVTLDGLDGERAIAVAVRARDEVDNAGPLSEVLTLTTNSVSPGAVSDLAAMSRGTDSVEVTWSASGEDGHIGSATTQELRYAPWSITSRTFVSATEVAAPAPGVPGSPQSVTVEGLEPGTLYRFAVVTVDEAGNRSALSNVAVVMTEPVPDMTPPADVLDLVASVPTGGRVVRATQAVASSEEVGFGAAGVLDDDPSRFWFTPPGASEEVAVLEVRFSGSPVLGAVVIDAVPGYESVFPVRYALEASTDGLAFESVDDSFAPQRVAAVRVTVLERARLGSAFYAAVGRVYGVEPESGSGAIVLDWSAVGDDGFDGRAADYRLAASGCPFDPATATNVPLEAPKASGAPERAVVARTSGDTTCFQLVVVDDAGNESAPVALGPIVP
ncbi:MAG: fibronectin type III domain-containing protein [Myxococcota bacterium]